MGLVNWWLRRKAKREGREFVESGPVSLRAWAAENKGLIGWGFLLLCAWAWGTEVGFIAFPGACSPLLGFDPTRWVSCEHVKQILGMIGSFLVGAGYIDPDRLKRAQRNSVNVSGIRG